MNDPYSTLSQRIQSGVYPGGSRLEPERQLAEEFGVARTTIRRAISRLTQDGLLESRPGCRPVVRSQAKSGAAGKHLKAVALLIGSEETYKPFSQILRGCEAELRRNDYLLVYMDTWAETAEAAENREARERAALENLRHHHIGGLVLWCQAPDASLPILREMREDGVAIVTIDREIPDTRFDYVGVDNLRSARRAVEHLLSLGHRRIFFATPLEDNASTVQDREEGYLQAMHRHGLPAGDNSILRFPFRASEGVMAEMLGKIVQAPGRPTAFFVMNDLYATHLVKALRSLGLRVPEDVSVVGFDDMEPPSAGRQILTTVRQPFEEIGRAAAQTVLQRLQEPFIPARHIALETTLIERSSAQAAEPDQEPAASPASQRATRRPGAAVDRSR